MKRLFFLFALLSLLTACREQPSGKPRMVWIEVGANFRQYGNSEENIRADCQRLAEAGFTHLAVEVRPTSGDVLFKSEVVPALTQVALWQDGGLKYIPRTADFDYLQAFIAAGHAAGLKVLAGVNMMVGGYLCEAGESGMLYDHPERWDWAAVDLHKDGKLVNHLEDADTRGGRFMDPANPDVQEFLLKMLAELASYEGLDGIIMDRCRYDDYALDAGYTDVARLAFGEYLGHDPERWPVFEEPGHIFLEGDPDELENQWLTFRCQVIHDFVARCVQTVHGVRANLPIGVYVGAWFSEYYRSGVNWTHPSYPLAKEEPTYRWATSAYQAAGFADLVDFLMLGTYCAADNLYGSREKTIEGFAKLGRKRLGPDVFFYAGPDLGNEPGFRDGDKAALIPKILNVLDREADGAFFFDLCYIRAFNYWDAFKQN